MCIKACKGMRACCEGILVLSFHACMPTQILHPLCCGYLWTQSSILKSWECRWYSIKNNVLLVSDNAKVRVLLGLQLGQERRDKQQLPELQLRCTTCLGCRRRSPKAARKLLMVKWPNAALRPAGRGGCSNKPSRCSPSRSGWFEGCIGVESGGLVTGPQP